MAGEQHVSPSGSGFTMPPWGTPRDVRVIPETTETPETSAVRSTQSLEEGVLGTSVPGPSFSDFQRYIAKREQGD